MFLENDCVLFLYLILDDIIPEVTASVRVKRDMSLELTFRKAIIKTRYVSHLLNGGCTITAVTQLCNVLAAVKSWVTDEGSMIYLDILLTNVQFTCGIFFSVRVLKSANRTSCCSIQS